MNDIMEHFFRALRDKSFADIYQTANELFARVHELDTEKCHDFLAAYASLRDFNIGIERKPEIARKHLTDEEIKLTEQFVSLVVVASKNQDKRTGPRLFEEGAYAPFKFEDLVATFMPFSPHPSSKPSPHKK